MASSSSALSRKRAKSATFSTSARVRAIAAILPFLIVSSKCAKHQRRVEDQLPEALDFLARVLRAGHSLATGLQMAAEELPDPLAAEFRRCYDQHSLGTALEVSMKEMADRFAYMEQLGHLRLVPPAADDSDPTHWELTGTKLLQSFGTGKIDPTVMNYARLGEAWRKGDTATFNKIVGTLHDEIETR